VIIFCAKFSQAQIAHYSQFYSTPMTIAPSFAGFTPATRMSLNYRDQWPAIPGTFTTFSLGLDHNFARAKSGLGLLVFRDQAGEGNLGLTEAGLQYSYNLKIGQKRGKKNNEWFLRPGIYFKYSQRSIDFEKLTFGDMILPDGSTRPTIEIAPTASKGYIDFQASLMGYAGRYWGGFAVDHLLRPDQSLTGYVSKLPIKVALFGGYKLYIKNKQIRRVNYNKTPENVTFTFHYRTQDNYDQLDFGAYWEKDPFTLGAWFRGIPVFDKNSDSFSKIDAIIVLMGYKIGPNLKIGYSYDMTISNLLSHTGGAHEISLIYEFNKNIDKLGQKHTIIPCPSF
jgi:type IX secretion system PorP/SprF family membrane protein